jgi:hypothetical protein
MGKGVRFIRAPNLCSLMSSMRDPSGFRTPTKIMKPLEENSESNKLGARREQHPIKVERSRWDGMISLAKHDLRLGGRATI